MEDIKTYANNNAFKRVVKTPICEILAIGKEAIGDDISKGACGPSDPNEVDVVEMSRHAEISDVCAWLKDVLEFPLTHIIMGSNAIAEETKAEIVSEASSKITHALAEEAKNISPSDSALVAAGWMKGSKKEDSYSNKGIIFGIDRSTTAPLIFRSLVEACAYGAKDEIERIRKSGLLIDSIIGVGGVALKHPFVMQILSDVLNMPIKTIVNDEEIIYIPNEVNAEIYRNLYSKYRSYEEFASKSL